MRPGLRQLRSLLLATLVYLASVLPAWGQQPPAWMKAAITGPDADWQREEPAVRLLQATDVRFVSPDRVVTVHRVVTRVHTNPGRVHAAARLGYIASVDRILSARAWLVTPDGRRTTAFPRHSFTDAAVAHQGMMWDFRRVLYFDGGSRAALGGYVGWEVEVESQTAWPEANWGLRDDLPVARATFEVTPRAGARLVWRTADEVPEPIAGSAAGALRWEMTRLAVDRKRVPTGFVRDGREVWVRSEAAEQPASWSQLSRQFASVVEPQLVLTPELAAKAHELVAGHTGRWERLRALCEFVQRDITYLALTEERDTLAGYRPYQPAEVLQRRYGDCKDKTALLIVLARAIGEDGYMVTVRAGHPRAVRDHWPSQAFNHAVVAFPAADVPDGWPVVKTEGPAGQIVLFDPTDPTAPLGVLPASNQGGYGLVVASDGGALIKLPVEEPQHVGVVRVARLTLAADGSMVAQVEETTHGAEAARLFAWRTQARDERFTQHVEQRWQRALTAASGLTWKDEWDRAAAQYRLKVELTAPRFSRVLGSGQLLVPSVLLPVSETLREWETGYTGVSWMPPRRKVEQVTLQLPSGYELEEHPGDFEIADENASCRIRLWADSDGVHCETDFRQRGGAYDIKDYERLRQFHRRVAEAQRRPVIVRPAATAAR
jgi:hypothetical protein